LSGSQARKIIVTCAVTGSIHTPSMSPHLPVTAEEIAEAAIAAAEAGASIVHLHARNEKDGRPDQTPEAFEPFLRGDQAALRRRREPDDRGLALHADRRAHSAGGALGARSRIPEHGLDEFRPVPAARPLSGVRACVGAGNARKFARSRIPQQLQFKTSDIEYALRAINETGARYEFECYDTSHLYNLHYFWKKGLVQAPLFIQTCFGLLGGIGSHPDDVMHMKRTADRLFGDQYHWSVLGAGRSQMPIAAMAAAMGGNVRVGLEDNLWIGPGQLAQSNASQVTKVRQILEGLGLEVATPTEARAMLSLKGGDNVGF
jgi:uncharacterized protein (DUF849 family)